MSEPNYPTPTERLLFDGATAAVRIQAILKEVWQRPGRLSVAEAEELLRCARAVQCVAEELDCRRRGRAAVKEKAG